MATVTASRLILGVRIQLVMQILLGRDGGSSPNFAIIVAFCFCGRMHA